MAIKVVLDGQSSTPHDIKIGVPWGSVLEPTLQTSDFFDKFVMTAELEEDLHCIVEWGEKWLCSIIQCYQDQVAVF